MDLNYVLKTLCEANGVSGEEKSASEAACELLKNYADNARVDVFGNVTAFIGEKDNGSTPPAGETPSDPGNSPQTGENSHMALWIALSAASVFGLAGTAVYSKKKE